MLREYLTIDIDLSCFDLYIEPSTFILDQKLNLPASLISEENTVAVRIPKNQFCLDLMTQLGKPIVSTSANISGEPSPLNFESISNAIKSQVDFIVPNSFDTGTGKASSIYKFTNQSWHPVR